MLTLEAHGDVTRLRFSTWRSRLVGYDVSAYVLRGVMVDTGSPSVQADVQRWLAELRPRGVVVTHWHEDHAGNVAVAARLGLPVALAPATLEALRAPGTFPLYRSFTWGAMAPLPVTPAPFEPREAGLALLAAPGHSPDHHVVWDAEGETLFAGDLFLGVKVRIAHPAEDARTLAKSLRAAAALRPRRLFDAHRGPVAEPVGSLLAKADWIEETVGAIERRLAAGWGERAVTRALLGREPAEYYFSRGRLSKIGFVRGVRRAASSV
jgi:glyoxylase-like metal-dependent hydrolase (beta-lactamase superfamily II)